MNFKKNLVNNINKIKVPYYYVPPCPECGGFMTGRILKSSLGCSDDWLITESLKNGEIIQVMPELPEDYNAFCLECECCFTYEESMTMISLEEQKMQKRMRGTAELYASHIAKLKEDQKLKESKRGFITNSFCKFLGI